MKGYFDTARRLIGATIANLAEVESRPYDASAEAQESYSQCHLEDLTTNDALMLLSDVVRLV